MAKDGQTPKAEDRPVPPRGAKPPRAPRARQRRPLPAVLVGVLAVLLVPLGLLVLLIGGLQTQPGRDLLRDLVVAQVSGPDLALSIGRIGGAPPGRLAVEELALADSEGVWLEADRLLLDWSPLALLGGTLAIETLEAGRVAVARLPATEAAEPAPERGFQLPALPVEVELERLAVGELRLGAPVLGEPLALTVEAALAAEREGRVESHLTMTESGGDGRIEAHAVYRLDDRHLTASLQASAPAGGRVSRVTGLPGAPGVAFSLQGEGPLPGWRAQWRAEASPVLTAEGRLGLDSLQPLSLLLAGSADPGPAFPAEAAPWIEPALVFELVADYDAEAETAHLEVRELSSGALAATGEAQAALADDTAQANLALRLADAGPLRTLVPALTVAGAQLTVDVELRDGQASATVRGQVEEPLLAAAGADGGVGFERIDLALGSGPRSLEDPLRGAGPVQLSLSAHRPRGDPALSTALAETTTLTLSVAPGEEALLVERLALESGSLAVTGSGGYRLEGPDAGSGSLQATVVEGRLGRLSDLAGLPLGGRLDINLDAELAADGSGRARLAADAEALQLGVPAAQALLGERPSLAVEAVRTPEGPIRVETAVLTGTPLPDAAGDAPPPRLSLQGSVAPDTGQLDATATLSLPRLARLQGADLPVSGAATLDLSAFGSLDAPQVVWSLRGDDLSYQNSGVERLQVDGTTIGLPEAPQGEVDLSADTGSGTLAGSFDYAVQDGVARIGDLVLGRGGDRLSGGLAVALETGTAEGELRLSIAELSAYESLTGQAVEGSAELTAALSAPEGRQRAELDGQLRNLALDDLRLQALDLAATGRDLTGTPRLQASAAAEGLALPDASVSRLEAEAEGDLEQLAVQVSLDGSALGQPLTASAQAELGLTGATRVALSDLEVRFGEETLALTQPATILLDGNRTRIKDLALALAGGSLTLQADLAPGGLEAELAVRDLPLRLVKLAAPELDPAGTLDLTASLSGAPPRPDGNLELVARGLQLSADSVAGVPPLELRLDGRLADGRLSAEGRLVGFARDPLVLQAELPLLVTATPPSVGLPQDQPIALRADWDGRLEQLAAVLPIDAVSFGGHGVVDLAVEGTLAAPEAAGSVTVDQGFYENYTLGMRLDPVALRLAGRGRRLELERFTGRDSEGGSLSAEGVIDLSQGVPRFDLRFVADNAHVAQRDDIAGAIDAELSLQGSTEGADLAGRIRTRPTEIRLINALPPSVTELDVIEVPEGSSQAEVLRERQERLAKAAETPGVEGLRWLALGVEVDIPGQVFVRGRGLDSEWRGTLQIAGTAQQPRIQGVLSPVRGSFDFAGRVFRLDPDSTIQFLGQTTVDPELDLVAIYEGSELTASIRVYGSVDDPQIELTSIPPLPEDEILARVLFGKSSGQLSAAEALQLAQAAETLQGGGGEGLMGIARRTLGVDVLSFAPGEGADDIGSLRIGKYVSEDVFIGAEQGTSPGSSAAIVEWELTPNITVESEVGADSRSNASIKWKWDY